MHARNILVSQAEAVLIDFAHYVSRDSNTPGVPLLDLAKLVVDLWCFSSASWSERDLLSGQVLDREIFGRVLLGERASTDELRLFRAAVACVMSRYVDYPDCPLDRKEAILAVLSHPSV
jgi:hypothetical protein